MVCGTEHVKLKPTGKAKSGLPPGFLLEKNADGELYLYMAMPVVKKGQEEKEIRHYLRGVFPCDATAERSRVVLRKHTCVKDENPVWLTWAPRFATLRPNQLTVTGTALSGWAKACIIKVKCAIDGNLLNLRI